MACTIFFAYTMALIQQSDWTSSIFIFSMIITPLVGVHNSTQYFAYELLTSCMKARQMKMKIREVNFTRCTIYRIVQIIASQQSISECSFFEAYFLMQNRNRPNTFSVHTLSKTRATLYNIKAIKARGLLSSKWL